MERRKNYKITRIVYNISINRVHPVLICTIFSGKWIITPWVKETQSLNFFLLRYSTMFVDNATAMLVAAAIKYSQHPTIFVKLEIHHPHGSPLHDVRVLLRLV